MYSISIYPPIIAIVFLVFLMLLDVLVWIYLWDTGKSLRHVVGIKEVLTYIVKLLLYVMVYLFITLNIVLIYTDLK
nr:MAG TPA: hypothetical protein [Caudoviricetes sp.]